MSPSFILILPLIFFSFLFLPLNIILISKNNRKFHTLPFFFFGYRTWYPRILWVLFLFSLLLFLFSYIHPIDKNSINAMKECSHKRMLEWSTINGRPIKRDRLFAFFFFIKNLAEFWQKRRHFYIYIYIFFFLQYIIYLVKKNL